MDEWTDKMRAMWAERKQKLDKCLLSNADTPTVRVEMYLPEAVFNWLSGQADKYEKSIEETATLIFSREAYKAIGGENG